MKIAFWYKISNSFYLCLRLKIFLINMITILIMSAKLGFPGLLKIKTFRNKGYDVIFPDYDITNKILSRESNYIVDVIV